MISVIELLFKICCETYSWFIYLKSLFLSPLFSLSLFTGPPWPHEQVGNASPDVKL